MPPDFRRLNPRLTEVDLAVTPFVPELSPVVDRVNTGELMTRPWLDWARRLTLLVASKTSGGGGGGGGDGMNLDYLGDYVTGPTYNDGDIVIGSDGVAYMCVVVGTTTPPEPWPGAGIAVNGTVDATYWVVSPHAQLTNERALSAMGTGYARSAVGEPSVVPTIPLSDTTGILPDNRLTSNVALKNIDNHFVSQTFAPWSVVEGPNATLQFKDTGSGVDQKLWRFINYNDGNLALDAVNDANSVIIRQYIFGRNGTLIAPAFNGNGAALTTLNASSLASGTVPLPRLGTNAPSASTFLRGDNTWAAVDAFPSGLIVISVSPCPIGWTRVGWDGYFLRGSASPGSVGGSDTHAHAAGSYSIPGHDHGTATTSAVGDHAHNFGIHAYFDSGNDSAGVMNVDGGGSGNMSRGPHTHRTQIDFDGGTSNSGNHSHTVGIPAVGAIGLQGGSDYASNVPAYVGVFFCQKN